MSRPTSYRNQMRPLDPKTCHVDFNRLEKQTKIRMARKWIETILDQKLPTHDLYSILSDGVILCKLINRLQPTIIPSIGLDGKIYSKIANIRRFLQAGNQLGLSSTELFQVYDLAEGRDMEAVVDTILALSALNLEDLPTEMLASIDIEGDLVKQRMYNSLPRPDSEQWSPNKVRRGRARGMTVSICNTEPWTGHMSPNRLSTRRLSTDTPQWIPLSPQDEVLRYYYDDEKENVFDSSAEKYQPLGILQTTNVHTTSTDEPYQATNAHLRTINKTQPNPQTA
ncbi:calponin homology domain-containing protein [Phycomyces nitens]|nr:calponin homology domain-containing protein [Phycomyces nitens]